MSQSFDFASNYTHTQLNGSDCSAIYLNGTRIWERYTAQRQVWVSSGYNTTGWQYWKNMYYGNTDNTSLNTAWYYNRDSNYSWLTINSSQGLSGVSGNSSNVSGNPSIRYWGAYKLERSTHRYTSRSGRYRWYAINVYRSVTTWVDTSSYQTEDYTAYYY